MARKPNRVLVRLFRGEALEAQHRGALVVVEGKRVVLAAGDYKAATYLRSAAKPFQTASALKSGIGNVLELEPADIAVISASHNGERSQVDRVERLLSLGGFGADDLLCGPHPPAGAAALAELTRSGEPVTALHNNCSGKHAGMLLTAKQLGTESETYLEPGHPVQIGILEAVKSICELEPSQPTLGVDGCSAPTFRMPLLNLAFGFRNLANPELADPRFQPELTAVRDAVTAHPDMVAGLDRIDTDLMRAGRGRFFSKIGAEGVMACGIPERGIGIAIKIDDGATRGYEALMLAVLNKLELLTAADREALARYLDPVLKNHAGLVIGDLRVDL